jgi:hypothetical protein
MTDSNPTTGAHLKRHVEAAPQCEARDHRDDQQPPYPVQAQVQQFDVRIGSLNLDPVDPIGPELALARML